MTCYKNEGIFLPINLRISVPTLGHHYFIWPVNSHDINKRKITKTCIKQL